MSHPDRLSEIFGRQSDAVPESLRSNDKLNTLFRLLPKCPYILIGKLGHVSANYHPTKEKNRAKNADLDLMVPVLSGVADDWETLRGLIGSEVEALGENEDLLVAREQPVVFLNPRYDTLSTKEKGTQVIEILRTQTTEESNRVHRITTGELILKIGENLDDKKSLKAEIFPLILYGQRSQEEELMRLGYLPDQGMTVLSTSGELYRVNVSPHHGLPRTPDYSYACESPHNAIMYLRRLTKSVINSFDHNLSKSQTEKRLKYYRTVYKEVFERYINGQELDEAAKSSLHDLRRKVKKLEKTAAKETKILKGWKGF